MIWNRSGTTAMSSPPWHVAKVTVRGMVSYELWHEKQAGMVGRFSAFDAAKHEAERQQTGQCIPACVPEKNVQRSIFDMEAA